MAKTQDGRNGSAEGCAATVKDICGDIVFPKHWTVFAPLERSAPTLHRETLCSIPETIKVAGKTLKAQRVASTWNQFDFQPFFGERHDPAAFEKTAYVFVPLKAKMETEVTLGLGGDYWLKAWVNGEPILGDTEVEDQQCPPSIGDIKVKVSLKAGANVLAVRFIAGKASSVLALGGPRELRAGDFRSILSDLFLNDARWARRELRAKPGTKPAVDIGSRLELFIDEFLVDRLTGSAERRLHHPVPREVVLQFGEKGKPWDGICPICAMKQEGGLIRIYYRGVLPGGSPDVDADLLTCLAESVDGIHFTHPELGLYEFNGSKKNNIVSGSYRDPHYTSFLDSNPDAPEDQRFKAIYVPLGGDGLHVFGSPDGIRWRALADKPFVTGSQSHGGFDGQNDAFWDPLRKLYVCFFRDNTGGLRRIATCTSKDFLTWTDPVLVTYADSRKEHMYWHEIRPYFRAPHLYVGTPPRFVVWRKKESEYPDGGINDAILMSSRDGLLFERWEEGFVRPVADPDVWTERNNYPVMGEGMVQTSPEEISLYWTEHYRHPGCRLRRGTIRTDGFVSVHAGGRDVGELLTRPLIFTGGQLEVNYATSAVGTMLFELCDEQGKAIKGFTLTDSEALFGNEIEHVVRWHGGGSLAALAGKPVRLRMRLHDADLYSFRFAPN